MDIMKRKFHIQHVINPCGMTHNRIVEYASADNVIRYMLPKMPAGQYMIHELDPVNIYRAPIKSTPAYRKA